MRNKKLIIMGVRGIPARHGGFETFAENLAVHLQQQGWEITVYCQNDQASKTIIDEWNGIKRVNISPSFNGKIIHGALGTILFDLKATWHAISNYRHLVWLVLGYNTAFLNFLPRLLKIKQIINMDGIEWRREKWSLPAKIFLYVNYKIAGWVGNILIADHPEIEVMLRKEFPSQKITMISYGSPVIDQADQQILNDYALQPYRYLVLIARLEPENNILMAVKAWSRKKRDMKLVIMGNYSSDQFRIQIKNAASKDVILTGPIYHKPTRDAFRHYCLANVHGHQVGGTNPTLVEALGAGSAIIAHDNPFNRWVAGNAGIYFKDENELADIFDRIENNEIDLSLLRQNARQRHNDNFQWQMILKAYEQLIESQF